ncbi:acyltransferase [Adlercreutzia sp. ZJ138]|uniref:acyltransferase n=1 Tax=Adlercreutzia sp. ZJ138 TaxID=2709405 RepID=UPI0013EA9219|nr:acyltransferase [Adlercreutzia sp. ZJ138]
MQVKKTIVAAARVFTTNIRFLGGKIVHRQHFSYSPVTCLALSDSIALSSKSSINFGKRLRTRGGCRFSVQGDGVLEFGDDVFLNSGCQFNCRLKMSIGSGCEFGPNVLVYDHDHDFRSRGGLKEGSFKYGEVLIGENCWIGAGTIILRGTTIGDNCVIGAGCVLNGSYSDHSLIVQKRDTSIAFSVVDESLGETGID